MKKGLLFIFNSIVCGVIAQGVSNPQAQWNVEEGKRLFRSEMASWHGTDLFLENFADQTKVGGYFSYLAGDKAVCVFYSNDEEATALATFTFDSTYQVNRAVVDLDTRALTDIERTYYELKENALKHIETDTTFKFYRETNLNLIPLVYKSEKRVYVLTASTRNDIVLFGNDYLITMDAQNEAVDSKALHANLIPIENKIEGNEEQEVIGGIHSHSTQTGDFITATDICTLMLYAPYTNWETHVVVSKHYLNSWNCKTNTLSLIPMKGVNKILKAEDKLKKKEQKRLLKGK